MVHQKTGRAAVRSMSGGEYPELVTTTTTTEDDDGHHHSSNGSSSRTYPGGKGSHAKVSRVLGTTRVGVPLKARKRLGSEMSVKQRRSQLKSDRAEAQLRRYKMRMQLEAILSQSPSTSQLMLPRVVVGQVPPKALTLFGDELLQELSMRQVPRGSRVTPKVLKFFGSEPTLMPRKARSLVVGKLADTDFVENLPQFKRQRRTSLSHLIEFMFPVNQSLMAGLQTVPVC